MTEQEAESIDRVWTKRGEVNFTTRVLLCSCDSGYPTSHAFVWTNMLQDCAGYCIAVKFLFVWPLLPLRCGFTKLHDDNDDTTKSPPRFSWITVLQLELVSGTPARSWSDAARELTTVVDRVTVVPSLPLRDQKNSIRPGRRERDDCRNLFSGVKILGNPMQYVTVRYVSEFGGRDGTR